MSDPHDDTTRRAALDDGDRGMQMFCSVVVLGAGMSIMLTLLWLAWPVLARLVGGL